MPSSALDDLGFAEPAGTAPPAASSPTAPPANGGDPAVWTLLGEAGADPQGQLAVGSTIVNRAARYGLTPQGIVVDPTQGYEAWNDAKARARTQALYPVGSPQYEAAQATLAGLQSGSTKPLPYTHFYAPKAQAADGRPAPQWSEGQQGTDIGGNRFYALPGQLGAPGSALDSLGFPVIGASASLNAQYTPGGGAGGAGQISGKPPDPQAATFGFLAKHGFRDETAPLGSSTNPAGQLPGGGIPSEPNSWYVTPQGQLRQTGDPTEDYLPQYETLAAKRAAMASQPVLSRLFQTEGLAPGGVTQGGLDVLGSVNKMTGGGFAGGDPLYGNFAPEGYGPSDLAAASLRGFDEERNRYNLLRGGDPVAAGGRFVGQAIPVTAAGIATGGALDAAGLGAAEGGNLFAQGLSRLGGGAVQGAQAAGLTSETSDRPVPEQLASGAMLGGGLGLAAPAVTGAAQRMIAGAPLSSGPITDLADAAMNKWGIPLRAGQIRGAAGDRAAWTADSNLVGSSPKFAANNADQKNAFMRGVTSTYGDPSGDVSPDAMQAAKTILGKVFDRVAANTSIGNTDALQSRLGAIVKNAQSVLPDNEVTPLLRQVQNIGSAIQDGKLSGETYQALTRKGAPLDRAMTGGDNPAYYAGQIRDALDDALEASAAPEDLADLRRARLQYKNLMTVAKLAPKQDANGFISPALLRGAVNTNFGNAAFQGAGDLGELAQVGQTFMKEPPNSFTANRAAHMLGPWGATATAIGEGAGLALNHPEAGLGVLGGVLAANAAKKGVGALQEARLGPEAANRMINPPQRLAPVAPYILPSAVVGGNRFLPAPTNP